MRAHRLHRLEPGDRGLQNVRQSLVEQRHAGRRLGAGLHTLRPNEAPQFRKKFVIDRRPCRSSIRHSLSRVSGAFVRTNFIFRQNFIFRRNRVGPFAEPELDGLYL
jgi:hypothetical protein